MKQIGLTFLKGLLMGAADVVPGVSGGTIAFITDIYDRLIIGIRNVGTALQELGRRTMGKTRRSYAGILKTIDWELFLPLGAGIALSFLIGSHFIPALIESYPALVYSFFIGLVLASAYHVYGHIGEHSLKAILWGVLGFALGLGLALAPISSATGGVSLPFVFLLGALAICAMILPGISGSYILLMLGQYTFMLDAVRSLDIAIVATFLAGAAIGLLSFARLLSWLLARHHASTFWALLGVMLGALWRPIEIASGNLSSATHTVWAICLFAIGAAIVLGIEHYSHAKRSRRA